MEGFEIRFGQYNLIHLGIYWNMVMNCDELWWIAFLQGFFNPMAEAPFVSRVWTTRPLSSCIIGIVGKLRAITIWVFQCRCQKIWSSHVISVLNLDWGSRFVSVVSKPALAVRMCRLSSTFRPWPWPVWPGKKHYRIRTCTFQSYHSKIHVCFFEDGSLSWALKDCLQLPPFVTVNPCRA